MKLEVKRLVLAPIGEAETYSVDLTDQEIDESLGRATISGHLKLTKLEDELMGKFEGLANLSATCDRCAAEYDLSIPLSFTQEYLTSHEPHDEEKLEVSKRFEIDLSEPIRQEIIAALPVKKLCLPDCAGVCPGCGVNLNQGKCECSKVKTEKV